MLQLTHGLWPDDLLLEETPFALLSTCLCRRREQMPMHFHLSSSKETYHKQGLNCGNRSELENIRKAKYQN